MDYCLQFLGAAGQVTGSRTLLTFGNRSYLVDCGLFQGPKPEREKNRGPFPKSPASLESIFLTHAHLDHSGYLPRLYRDGYRGQVHCTAGTRSLAQVLLLDSAKLQEEDAAYANRTGHSSHKPALPLYTTKDVELVLGNFSAHPRDEWVQVGSNLGVRFIRAGHIVGASFVQFSLGGGHGSTLVTFSGDVGHSRSKILRGPETVTETDILVLESTYGNRRHSERDSGEQLADVVNRTMNRRGVLVIPAFAVGRAQELIYLLKLLEDQNKIPAVPVILDSPMSVTATELFLKHTEDHIHPEAFASEVSFFPKHFEATQSQDDSMLSCMRDGPLVVISASGMLSGGRVLHHLKKRLPDPANTVLFAGYQAEGSKGRYLQDLAGRGGTLRIHHQEIPVAAEIASIDGLSAHADADGLLKWLEGFRRPPKKVILNHGTQEATEALGSCIRERFGWKDVVALKGEESFHLNS